MQLETSKSMIRTVKRMCGSYYAPGILMAIFIMSICVVENRVIEDHTLIMMCYIIKLR